MMPSDIRSFFGKGGAPPPSSSQEKIPSKASDKEKKSKTRGKRKVLSDSDDEIEMQPQKKPLPKKPLAKKREKSPGGEVITTSDYFASSGKSKPLRSTPLKTKSIPDRKAADESKMTSAASMQKSQVSSEAKSAPNGGNFPRKKSILQHVDADEENDDNFEPRIIQNDENLGADIYEADYKQGKSGGEDAYDSDGDHDMIQQSTRKIVRTRKGTSSKRRTAPGDENDDVIMKEVAMEDIPKYKEPKTRTAISGAKTIRARKRKSVELSEGESEDKGDIQASKKLKDSKAKSPAKKVTPKKGSKEDGPPARTEVDVIFDSIVKVRVPTPPPRDEGKKFNYTAFNANRSDPSASSGPTDLPEGAENCLAGLTFVFTGILNTLGREKGQELVKRYGGKITGAPSRKTSFVIIGADAGPKKLETIKQYSLRTIDEQGLFELIRRLPANGGDGKAAEQFEARKKREEEMVEKAAEEMARQERAEAKEAAEARGAVSKSVGLRPTLRGTDNESAPDKRLWTVKYAPTAINMMCGNKAQIEKLQAWLRAWPTSLKSHFKKPGKDGWGVFRAMCLHGPPGIGKTTAAHLAAKLEGYDILESNASDTRSKKLVETGLKGVLDTTSLLGYFSAEGKLVETEKKRLVLIMDEVDGMSAGDRGGVGALASVCKKNSIPIILICNDRKLPKMKPFDHVAFDLPFRRPTVDMIRQRIMTICFREKLKIPPNVINALIEGSHSDIRQVINMLSTAKLDQDSMDFDSGKEMSKSWEKHVILKPWDIVSKILGGGLFAPSNTSSLNEKIELYFNDHEFSSLMLQENYLSTYPMLSNKFSGREKSLKVLELTDQAAESISDGDLVDRMIHGSQQQWALMPTHAVFSFVRPASFVSGSQAGSQTRFTSWLGNNSKQGKLTRFVKEIQGHMRLRASGDRHEIRQQYLPLLWYRLIKKLQTQGKDGVSDIIDLMDSYYLTKDDWDAILELGIGPMDMEHIKIDTQTKTSFTRCYNQMSHPLPYMKTSQVIAPKKKSKERPDIEDALEGSDSEASSGEDQGVLEQDEPLDLKKDKYVAAPKKKNVGGKTKTSRVKSKGKGRSEVDSDDDDDEVQEDVKPRKDTAQKGKRRNKK